MSDEIKCVRDTLSDNKISYCGKNISVEWHFLEPTHAILTMQDGNSRFSICYQCQKKIINIMKG